MKVRMNSLAEVELSFIRVNAYVGYWEDAYVNDTRDDYENPVIPCVDSEKCYWQPYIDIETGQILNWKKGVTAQTDYKVRDEFECDFLNGKEEVVKSYSGYVPPFMYPGKNGFGDYVILDINEEGYIKGWNKDLVSKFLTERLEKRAVD